MVIPALPDLTTLSHAQKDALIVALWEQVVSLTARLTALEQRLNEPGKTPDNSSLPPPKGRKPNRSDIPRPAGPRKDSLGRKGGSRSTMAGPDQMVSARATGCRHCGTLLAEADHHLHGRYDKIELPRVRPVVTRVERYAGLCPCCGGMTLAPVPDGLEQGSPSEPLSNGGPSIVAMALYLRFTHAISYQRLRRLFEHLFGLAISEGVLDALFRRAKPAFDDAMTAILARLRRSRIVCSDETGMRVDGHTCWNWVFQNAQVVIHVVRQSRSAGVVAEVTSGHRPAIWVSDLFGAQQGHADLWQVCLAHQLRDCRFAIDAGDTVFAPRMKALLLRAVLLARRRHVSAASTRGRHRRRLDRDLDAVMALGPTHRHGQRLRKRYGKVRGDLFTFLVHPDAPPDTDSSERELRPTATCRKVTGGFRSQFPLAMGRRSVRQRQIRRRHGRTPRHRRLRGHPQHAMRVPEPRAEPSRYLQRGQPDLDITGVDVSSENIAQARGLFKASAGQRRPTSVHADCLDFTAGCFDAILADSVFNSKLC